ncbi:LUZP2 protein, partial [Atractosteus spatula]|nr:LUZP2 protein [Atractosteus spatula]
LFPFHLCVRQSYEGLERKLKEVFMERSGILRQLSKTSKELEGIKGNLQSLKNDETVAKKDVLRILELSQKQREEMKSLQEALQKQLNEAAEKAEKQQATISFFVFQNKSLKNKLLSGSKLCGIHAEESKKIQAQLKELRYGKKDLIFKGQQLTDLERKLTAAKQELEKAALDKESQLKALKETVHLCLSSVLHNQPPTAPLIPSKQLEMVTSPLANSSRVTFQQPHTKDIPKILRIVTTNTSKNETMKRGDTGLTTCQTQEVGTTCFKNQTENLSLEKKTVDPNSYNQKPHDVSQDKNEVLKSTEDDKRKLDNSDVIKSEDGI